MIYKTRGIILKRRNFSEADRILTIYTLKKGKVVAIARGIRKIKSKMAGHLEPFCLVDLQLVEGKNFDTITGAEIIKANYNLRHNLNLTNHAYYLAEIIDSLTREKDLHEEVFELFSNSLQRLDSGLDDLFLSYFEINILANLGFRPELYQCLVCEDKIKAGGNSFSFEDGGLTCPNCQSGCLVSDSAIKALRLFLDHDIKIIDQINSNKTLTNEIKNITDDYIKHIHQKDFKSRRFLKGAV